MSTPTSRPARLAVGVIGAGRAGCALGVAFNRAGHRVVAVSGVSDASRRRAEAAFPGVPVLPAEDVARAAELLLLTVPDAALPALVETLAAQGVLHAGQLVVHVSGCHGLGVLEPAARAGAVPLALHPVMTFPGAPEDADRLAGAVFGVTAPDGLRHVAEVLVLELGGEPVHVPDDARPAYHAALSWGANYLVTLTTTAVDLLTAAGVESPTRVLAPLLGASLDTALRYGDAGLTGPVSRGDAGTVAAHLDALRTHLPSAVDAYVSLARLTADRALADGRLDPGQGEALLAVLADAPAGAGR